MPRKLARDIVACLFVFAFTIAIARIDFGPARAARPYVVSFLTDSTDLPLLASSVRDVATRLLGWNPWARPSTAVPDDGSAVVPTPAGGGPEVSPRELQVTQPVKPEAARRAVFSAPVHGRVTYAFGYRVHPILRRRLFHEGLDIAAPKGEPVKAAAGGTVLRAGLSGTYGLAVEIDHGGGCTTLYAHCSRVVVHPGDLVTAGQKVAEVGSTGLSTGPHLHFEVAVGGVPCDPFTYLGGGRRDAL